MNSSTEWRHAAATVPALRTVAVHVEGDPGQYSGVGADRVWVGVRACCELFVALAGDGTIGRWLRDAASVGATVGLATPVVVPEPMFEPVFSAICDLSPLCARVLTGDYGIVSTLRGSIPVSWYGSVLNRSHAGFLRDWGVDSVRAFVPVDRGVMDINRHIDVEMPVFGRIPVAFLQNCPHRQAELAFSCPSGCPSFCQIGKQPRIRCDGGEVTVMPKYLESSDFLDLSQSLRTFGRDTCAVIETSGLSAAEVAGAVDAIRHGRPVETGRPLFCPIPEIQS